MIWLWVGVSAGVPRMEPGLPHARAVALLRVWAEPAGQLLPEGHAPRPHQADHQTALQPPAVRQLQGTPERSLESKHPLQEESRTSVVCCVVCFVCLSCCVSVVQVDSSRESAEAACDILSQLVNCSLKTLGLISTARPSFMEMPKVRPLVRLKVWSLMDIWNAAVREVEGKHRIASASFSSFDFLFLLNVKGKELWWLH